MGSGFLCPGEFQVQFTGKQVDDRDKGPHITVPLGPVSGGLDDAVDTFQDGVGQSGIEVVEDAGPVRSDGRGE